MAQIKNGIRKILENPVIYNNFQNILGAANAKKYIIEIMEIKDGMNILDVGCGTGGIVKYINYEINYYGFDFQKEYIDAAIKKYGPRYNFIHSDVKDFDFNNIKFDRIMILGLLHHLEDIEVNLLFSKLEKLLAEKGKVICLENCLIENQEFIARKLIEMDRGKNVRFPEGYAKITKKFFKNFEFEIRKNLLRIPYTHVILNYSK